MWPRGTQGNFASLARPSPRALGAFKAIVFVAALLPAARLIAGAAVGRLGANPVEFLTRSTGTWTLVFLCVTLGVTPLRKFSGWHWLARLRRMLGLFAFFYGVCHFTTYVWFDQFFDPDSIAKDVFKRPFVTVGFAAFVLMLPLALTSFDRAVRALGGVAWRRLHMIVYGIAPLGVLHFWWHKAGKNDLFEPRVYAVVVALVLLVRIAYRLRRSGIAASQRAT
jgi:methionine sulfoxide reductase heme-binding subunit